MTTFEIIFSIVWGLTNTIFLVLIVSYNYALDKKEKEDYYKELVVAKMKRVSGCLSVKPWMIVYFIVKSVFMGFDFFGLYIASNYIPHEFMVVIYISIAITLATVHVSAIEEYRIIRGIIKGRNVDFIYKKYYKKDVFIENNIAIQINMFAKSIMSIYCIAFI